LTPTLRAAVLPVVAGATALATVPTLRVTIAPAIATATATGLVPTLVLPITILAPVATATASGLIPTIVTIVIFISDGDSAIVGMDSDSAMSVIEADFSVTSLGS
jgi:hypothetical protein